MVLSLSPDTQPIQFVDGMANRLKIPNSWKHNPVFLFLFVTWKQFLPAVHHLREFHSQCFLFRYLAEQIPVSAALSLQLRYLLAEPPGSPCASHVCKTDTGQTPGQDSGFLNVSSNESQSWLPVVHCQGLHGWRACTLYENVRSALAAAHCFHASGMR